MSIVDPPDLVLVVDEDDIACSGIRVAFYLVHHIEAVGIKPSGRSALTANITNTMFFQNSDVHPKPLRFSSVLTALVVVGFVKHIHSAPKFPDKRSITTHNSF
jgi:hypothetical protein